jgi:hypothetical protein
MNFIAHITTIWVLTTMYALINYQVTLMNERLIEHITAIWAITTMYELMPHQLTLLNEYLIAHITAMSAQHYVCVDVSPTDSSI